jgi:UDP-N-acetylglucosamine 2-epimerase
MIYTTPMIRTPTGLMCERQMKIMTIVGTRPELIRMSAVIKAFEQTHGVEHVLVHTGQNWDPALRDVFFRDLDLSEAHHTLNINVSSVGAAIGDIIRETERVLLEVMPDAVVVLGDTNSAYSLVIAKRMGIPTYHLEAGNRCFDSNVPEETNRRIVDHCADFNLAYTNQARLNLLNEGLETRRILVIGSPMREVLAQQRGGIDSSTVLDTLELEPEGYFVLSAHRQENVDDPSRLAALLDVLTRIEDEWNLPVIFSAHPRTKMRLAELGRSDFGSNVRLLEPFGFHDYVKLQMSSSCVLSDSGTIAEESAILNFPAVTLRGSIERPEALDTGSITMVDLNPDDVIRGIHFAMNRPRPIVVPDDYAVANTSERVVNFVISTASRHKEWSGLR